MNKFLIAKVSNSNVNAFIKLTEISMLLDNNNGTTSIFLSGKENLILVTKQMSDIAAELKKHLTDFDLV